VNKPKLIGLLFCSGCLLGQGWAFPPQEPVAQSSIVSPLKVEITGISEQHYCKNETDLFTVYLKTQLIIANPSAQATILPKTLSPALRARVSMSLEDAERRKFVYDPSPYEVSKEGAKSPRFGAAPDPAIFTILRPGAKYATSIWVGMLADLSAKQNSQQPGMTSGDFVVQVFVRTWPYSSLSQTEFENVKSNWSREGEVLNQIISSNFYPLSLPTSPVAPSCDKFKAPRQ
jgi:hypothetical protein